MVLLLLIVVPIIELFVMVQVAGVIGALPTVLAVVAMSLAGLWLMKVEGLRSIRRLGDAVERGDEPVDEVLNGVLILVGGLLMFVPGFVTGPRAAAPAATGASDGASRRVVPGRPRFIERRVGAFHRLPHRRLGGYTSGVSGRLYDVDSRLVEPDGGRRPVGPTPVRPELDS